MDARAITSLPTKLDLDKIGREIDQIDDFWRDGSGAYMALRPCSSIPDWLKKCPETMNALREIANLRKQSVLYVMINKLPPNTIVPNHTDTLIDNRRVERWHLPIKTNAHCFFWDNNFGFTRMLLNHWWGPIPYWTEHAVENTGLTERIHLVVDLDTP